MTNHKFSATGIPHSHHLSSNHEFEIVGWYANYRTYEANYQPSNIPDGVDMLMYAFAQIGNCLQDPGSVPTQWQQYKSDGTIQCKSSSYATGKLSDQIYSTDPYADLLKWPPNDVKIYQSYVPGKTIPSKLPDYWPDLKGNIAFNDTWSYQTAYNAWDGKGCLKKSIEKNDNVYISIGGWSGSIPLLKAMNSTSEQQRKTLNDFTFKFLPAALPKDQYNEKQWGVFPPYNPSSDSTGTEMVKGFDIDLEPYANDWTKMSCDEIDSYVNYITNVARAGVGKITISITGNPNVVEKLGQDNINTIANNVYKINLMTYDYHGAFDNPAKTNCHSPLFCDPNQPNDILGRGMFNTHASVKAWIDAGVDPSKLVIGAAAYGREVSNVKASSKEGSLYQSFNDPIGKTPLYNNENLSPGQSIKKRVDSGQMQEKFNKDSGCAYAYDSSNKAFVSYDNLDSITMKTCYALQQGLGGVMLWDLGGDSENLLIQRAIDVKNSPSDYCKGDFSFDNIDSLMKQSELCHSKQEDGPKEEL